jgi:hypothetical protein
VETACSNTKIKNKFLVILTGLIVKYVVTESVTNNRRPDSYSLAPVSLSK